MPAVSRLGDNSTGHGCFPPTPIVVDVSGNIFVNSIACATVGSKHSTHSCGLSVHPTSSRNVSKGSPTVFCNGKPMARIGDTVACGDAVGQGSGNVFAG